MNISKVVAFGVFITLISAQCYGAAYFTLPEYWALPEMGAGDDERSNPVGALTNAVRSEGPQNKLIRLLNTYNYTNNDLLDARERAEHHLNENAIRILESYMQNPQQWLMQNRLTLPTPAYESAPAYVAEEMLPAYTSEEPAPSYAP